MRWFLAHVGAENSYDLDYTVRQRRTFEQIARSLPRGWERDYFEHDSELHAKFPNGSCNVWGVPEGAEAPYEKTAVGDVVLFAPSASRSEGLIQYFGIVKAIPWRRFEKAPHVLWPESGRTFPYLFFFDAEEGVMSWFDFTAHAQYAENWNPNGHYVCLSGASLPRKDGGIAYLDRLRREFRFKPVD
ncbi:hypothetical protein [Opitutus sp. ER46]|uniref:hypothetical protein n=1 Tax=Opitutus sp. ER46 TaxID=2161864 RepID=UPI0011B27FF8|nr:hypothetical protein [Opitutus sp. ER46]